MAHCKHHDICGRDADENTGDGLCILHSPNPEKDTTAFDAALDEHSDPNGPNRANKDNFSFFVFPGDADFREAWFRGDANFAYARFHGKTDFNGALFDGKVDFRHAKLKGEADFNRAKLGDYAHFGSAEFTQAVFELAQFRGRVYFSGVAFGDDNNPCGVNFSEAAFSGDAHFGGTTFNGPALFRSAIFKGEAYFGADAKFFGTAHFVWTTFGGDAYFVRAKFKQATFDNAEFHAAAYFLEAEFAVGGSALFKNATFAEEADFEKANFSCETVFDRARFSKGASFHSAKFSARTSFQVARFQGRTLFLPRKENGKIVQVFSGADVDFRWVILEPLDVLVMRDADLSKCQFLGTDLRKAEITGATWPELGGRFGVYDERCSIPMDATREWYHIERLYRELKQNHEDRRDFERARDFHYGEKEMRWINPRTNWWYRRCLLWPYWLVSGYGERCLRPLAWAGILFGIFTAVYFWGGLLVTGKDAPVPSDPKSILDVALYSLRVMLLLKPDEFVCTGSLGRAINTVQSVVGPLLVGLFALAVRQRLKR